VRNHLALSFQFQQTVLAPVFCSDLLLITFLFLKIPPTKNMPQDLEALHTRLAHVFSSMDAHRPTRPQPPIIDASPDILSAPQPETVPGFRSLKESIKRDLDALEKVLSPHSI
jgi:hypothetical protein